jgi:hypothetical protein
MGKQMQAQNEDKQAFQLLLMIEEEVRRSGGKHLLSRQEYLEIVAYCYQQIYGIDKPEEVSSAAN